MKAVLIAYADSACEFSLRRIGKQAKRLKIFEEVILWRPKDLPNYIKESPLMQYSYGGGYWAWKPCIIWETLQRYDEDTVVCYVDAGCTLRSGIEWTLYLELMKSYETLLFKYRDTMLAWNKFGSTSTKIKHWTKKNAIEFYDRFVDSKGWRECNKILGGVLFVKGKNNEFVQSWLDIVMHNPEVIMDPNVTDEQFDYFAQHKHDQPTLTALSFMHRDKCIALPELCETCGENVAICATRVRCATRLDYVYWIFKKMIRNIFGERVVNKMRLLIK